MIQATPLANLLMEKPPKYINCAIVSYLTIANISKIVLFNMFCYLLFILVFFTNLPMTRKTNTKILDGITLQPRQSHYDELVG